MAIAKSNTQKASRISAMLEEPTRYSSKSTKPPKPKKLKKIMVTIDEDLHQQIKVKAVQQKIPMRNFISNALAVAVKKR